MPRYFFDTDNGSTLIIDDVGCDLPDDAAARRAGLDALPDMARDKTQEHDHRTFSVSIRDADRHLIYSATLALMGGWRNKGGASD